MMQVEKSADSSQYLKAEFVKENKITELKIDDARSFEITTFEGKDKNGNPVKQEKLQCNVIYNGQGKEDPSIWTMNNKSKNALIDAFGTDTNEWVNKVIPIQLQGEGEYVHIAIDTLRIGN